jgi:hypothetical protein
MTPVASARSEYAIEASRILKAELARRGLSYRKLSGLLQAENELQLKTKINRGSFSAAFFIRVMRAIGADHVDLRVRVDPKE